MKQRFLSPGVWGAATVAALVCAITLTAVAVPDHRRTAGDRAGVDIENFGKVNDHFYRYYRNLLAQSQRPLMTPARGAH